MSEAIYALEIEGLGLEESDVLGESSYERDLVDNNKNPLILTYSKTEPVFDDSLRGELFAVDCIDDLGGILEEEVDLTRLDIANSNRTFSLCPIEPLERFFSLLDQEPVAIAEYKNISHLGPHSPVKLETLKPFNSFESDKILFIQSSVMFVNSITNLGGGLVEIEWEPIFGTDFPNLSDGFDDRAVYVKNVVIQGRRLRLLRWNKSLSKFERRWGGFITSMFQQEDSGFIQIECAGFTGSTNRENFGFGAPSGTVRIARREHSKKVRTFPAVGGGFNVRDNVWLRYGQRPFTPVSVGSVVSIKSIIWFEVLHGDYRSINPVFADDAEPQFAKICITTSKKCMELGGQILDENGEASNHFIDIALNLLMSSGGHFPVSGITKQVPEGVGGNGDWDWLPEWAGLNIKQEDVDVDSFLYFRDNEPFSNVYLENFLAGHKEEEFSTILNQVLASGGCFLTESNGKLSVSSFVKSHMEGLTISFNDDNVTVEEITSTNPDILSGVVHSVFLRCADDFPSGSYRHTIGNVDFSLAKKRRYGSQVRKIDISLPYLGDPETGIIKQDTLDAVRYIYSILFGIIEKESCSITLTTEHDSPVKIGDFVNLNLTSEIVGNLNSNVGFCYSLIEDPVECVKRCKVRIVGGFYVDNLISPSFMIESANATNRTITIHDSWFSNDDIQVFFDLLKKGFQTFEIAQVLSTTDCSTISMFSFTNFNQSTGVISGLSSGSVPWVFAPGALIIRPAPYNAGNRLEDYAYIGGVENLDGDPFRRWSF